MELEDEEDDGVFVNGWIVSLGELIGCEWSKLDVNKWFVVLNGNDGADAELSSNMDGGGPNGFDIVCDPDHNTKKLIIQICLSIFYLLTETLESRLLRGLFK